MEDLFEYRDNKIERLRAENKRLRAANKRLRQRLTDATLLAHTDISPSLWPAEILTYIGRDRKEGQA